MRARNPAGLAARLSPTKVREGLQKVLCSEDTIVAIATPQGRSGIGVVRISGSNALAIAQKFLRRETLDAQRAAVCQWIDERGDVVDDVVAVFFRGPRSYTGEDVLEVSAHGNPLVLHLILTSVQRIGVRLAAPGEFTLRAVSNGKLDLIQAEAVRDFIEAQTEAQARTARLQLEGSISRRIAPIKEELVGLIARLEAGIDFAEDDVEAPDSETSVETLRSLVSQLEGLQATYGYGRILGNGVAVAIVGRPNVGKSSLFNRLLEIDRAIVTEIPGTTRDIVSEAANLEGIPVRLYDTAGIRETTDIVEGLGVSRTLEALNEADFAVVVVDGSNSLTEEDGSIYQRVRELPHIIVANKCDLGWVEQSGTSLPVSVRVSAKTGEGLALLRAEIGRRVGQSPPESVGDAVVTSARQSEGLLRSMAALRAGETALAASTPHEMVLLDLYAGLSALNELTGETTSEDILGSIFSTFCIGK